jgi:cell division protein FtsL
MMKKVLRIAGIPLGILLLVACMFCAYVAITRAHAHRKPTQSESTVELAPQRAARY